jgi:hypothetical protein
MSAMRGTTVSLIALAGLAAVLGGAGCVESSGDEPVNPSYTRNIKPLMEAHCIRCHGAGGTLNGDPDIAKVNGSMAATNGDFTTLADASATIFGLMHYVNGAPGAPSMGLFLPSMPPPPAPPLTTWEKDVLLKWLANPLP